MIWIFYSLHHMKETVCMHDYDKDKSISVPGTFY